MAESFDGLYSLIKNFCLRMGSQVNAASGAAVSASAPVYIDSNSQLATGAIPFAIPMASGVTSTSAVLFTVRGSSTQSANELYHQTLVYGTVASTLTVSGLMRVTVTDDAGNITTGDYYVPFGTLA